MKTKDITTLALLVTLSVVGRVYFSFIPNIQPTTVIIIVSSFLLGTRRGVIVATLSAIVSNMVLGMGIWTLWQVIAWSLIGFISGLVGTVHAKTNINLLALYAGFCGLFYGLVISIFSYKFLGSFWSYYLAGLSFDFGHAFGNMLFFYLLYPVMKKLFQRFYFKIGS